MQRYPGITPALPRNYAKILYILTENYPGTTPKLYESLTNAGKMRKNRSPKHYTPAKCKLVVNLVKVNNYITIVI